MCSPAFLKLSPSNIRITFSTPIRLHPHVWLHRRRSRRRQLRELIVPETRLNENATLLRAVDDRESATAETVRTNKAGEFVDVSMQIAPLLVDGPRWAMSSRFATSAT